MWNWIVALWNRAIKAFKDFLAVALPTASQIIIGELKDFAIQIVTEVDLLDLTSDEKRKEAGELIKQEAIKRGIGLTTSLLNALIELAVQYLKQS